VKTEETETLRGMKYFSIEKVLSKIKVKE